MSKNKESREELKTEDDYNPMTDLRIKRKAAKAESEMNYMNARIRLKAKKVMQANNALNSMGRVTSIT